MKKLIISFVLIIAEVLCNDYPVVNLKTGKIQGSYQTTSYGKQYAAFRGVPYAAPPVGELRFEEPQPVLPWKGVWDANYRKINCLQYDHDAVLKKGRVQGAEDCLYLHIFTPKLLQPEASSKFDVIVYFHPGAFMFGGADWFGEDYLMNYNIVLVTVNYRLGILGFLSTEDDVIPGNLGLKDQVFSLQWVKENIAYFGGNSDSVTIAGVSAGAASVHYHYLSPLSKGLFHRGISLSGTSLSTWANAKQIKEKAFKLGKSVGCFANISKQLLECLRNRPASLLLEKTFLFQGWLYNPFSPFGPVVEKPSKTAFITKSPYKIFYNKMKDELADLPWICGHTTSEGLYPAAEFLPHNELLAELDSKYMEIVPLILHYNKTFTPSEKNNITKLIKQHYFGNKTISNKTTVQITQMIGDKLFVVPARESSKLQAEMNKSPVYMYEFNFRGTYSLSDIISNTCNNYGVSHADDAGYIFNTTYFKSLNTENEKKMGSLMQNMWVNYAKNGDPTASYLNWKPLKKTDDINFLRIDEPTRFYMKSDYDHGQFSFWHSINGTQW